MGYEKIRYDRIFSAHRQGNGAKLQMFGGQTGSPLSDPGENEIAIYDAYGNVVSSGQTIADVIASAGGGSGGGPVTVGARADRPASPSEAGEQYYCTDAHYHYVAGGSPLGWQAYYMGIPVTEPADADFGTWFGPQGSATTSEAQGGVLLTVPAQASGNWRGKVKTIPSAPYTVTALIGCSGKPQSYWQAGLVLRQSSDGKFAAYSTVYELTFNQQTFNSPTSFAGTYTNYPSACRGNLLWIQIEDDNTNRITRISLIDSNFSQTYSISRTDFCTPDQIGFGVDLNNSEPAYLHLISWKEE